MPTRLESGNYQLDDHERRLYADAARLALKALNTCIALDQPLSMDELTTLAMAHAVVIGDDEWLDSFAAKLQEQLAKHKHSH